MAVKGYEIKVVSRNRCTGEEIVNVSPEYMARAVYGDELVDAVIANGKIENTSLEIKNASR